MARDMNWPEAAVWIAIVVAFAAVMVAAAVA
jgi:hypothetical protein